MKKDVNKLLVCAHPDDEVLFFSTLLGKETHVICVTDANADGRGVERRQEFEKALKSYNVDSFEMWDFPDIYDRRIDQSHLQKKLKNYLNFKTIYTHGPLGEYGHPHHQDISYACYEVFDEDSLWISAYNTHPSKTNRLDKTQFEKKQIALTEIYGKETKRFLNLISITSTEGFTQITKLEVDSIFKFLTDQSQKLELNKYCGLEEIIQKTYKNKSRLF